MRRLRSLKSLESGAFCATLADPDSFGTAVVH